MKTLYIARHAEAVNLGAPGVHTDFDRHLTDRGLARLGQQARALKRIEPRLEACFASPLVRTRQTAEALCAPYGCPIVPDESLGSSPDLQGVRRLLAGSRASRLLLVTHQPFVVQLTSWLLTGDSEVATQFNTAAIACVQLYMLDPAPRGELLWLLPAELMANLDPG